MVKITLTSQQREEGKRIAKRSMELQKILNERKAKEAEMLQVENQIRTENNQPTVEQELAEMLK